MGERMDFKMRLRELRKQQKLSQNDVAKVLEYGYTTICNYEGGRNEPSIKDLIRLAQFFNVSVDYLIGANNTYREFDDNFTLNGDLRWFYEFYYNLPEITRFNIQVILKQLEKLYYH